MFCFVFHYSTWEKKPQFRCTFPVLRLRIYLQRTVYYNQNATTSWPFTDLKSCHKHKTVTFVDYCPYRFLSVINVYNLKTTENTFHNLVSVNKCFWLSYTMTSNISLGSSQFQDEMTKLSFLKGNLKVNIRSIQLKSPYEPFHEHFRITWK